jgi:hypothetical protein
MSAAAMDVDSLPAANPEIPEVASWGMSRIHSEQGGRIAPWSRLNKQTEGIYHDPANTSGYRFA